MATMAENVIAAENGEMLKDSIENGPYKFKSEITIKDTDGVTNIHRAQRLKDLAGDDKLRYDSDIKAVNILLLGLPVDIYTIINHYQTAKEIWDRVKELMEGTKMTKQECESKLYDEFDKFTFEPGESIHSYYLRFAKLINDMNMIPMSMTPMQINTKFMNYLQPEWSRFVTAAKQARNPHSVTFDQLYAFLKHNERDAKEVQEMRQRFLEPLALLENTYNPPPSYNNNQTPYQAQPSEVYQPYQQYQSSTPITQQLIHSPPLQSYAPIVVPQPPTFQPDTRLAIPTFLPTDDPIACLNKAMIFLGSVYRSKFPPTNNQLRTSSNPRTQATIQNGQVTVQNVQAGNTWANQPRVIRCYNCNGEGHMAKQCTAKKRVKDSEWFKDKMLLAQAQEVGVVLDEEQHDFLTDSDRSHES
ncbi:retrovirus-related pol polyprotein from transposon TNT 1-94 [Tanacetum coccineum]